MQGKVSPNWGGSEVLIFFSVILNLILPRQYTIAVGVSVTIQGVCISSRSCINSKLGDYKRISTINGVRIRDFRGGNECVTTIPLTTTKLLEVNETKFGSYIYE